MSLKRQNGYPQFLGSTPYALVVAATAAFSGLLGSLYADSIKSSVPFVWSGWTGFSWPSLVFWCTFLASSLMFALRSAYDGAQVRALATAASEIKDVVSIVPPRSFLVAVTQAGALSRRSFSELVAQEPRRGDEDFAKEARRLLRRIADLARQFDEVPDHSLGYSANVMLFVDATEASSYWRVVKFAPPEAAPSNYLGLLWLDPSLAATSSSDEDANIDMFALPVPKQARTPDGRWRALPGAPAAFLRAADNPRDEVIEGFRDTHLLERWFGSRGSQEAQIVREVCDYFTIGDGRNARSFVSWPLYEGHGDQRTVIGVVNLHSGRTDILSKERLPQGEAVPSPYAQQRQELFTSSVAPLFSTLTDLIRFYKERFR